MRVLIISVHPDDETLGCGGTILRHAAGGDEIGWLIVTSPDELAWPLEIVARKSREIERVAEAYRMRHVTRVGLPTTRLDALCQSDLIQAIRSAIAEMKPDTVYLVHGGDIHTDHNAVFTAAMSVLKPFHLRGLGVRRVLCYETLSSTDAAPAQAHLAFLPTVYHDIGGYLERKIEIMGLYETETQPEPMPRSASSIRALARHRGATIGVEYAEAFELIREIA